MDETTLSVGIAVVTELPPMTVTTVVVYRSVDEVTRADVMVVAWLTVERWIVVAAEPEPMTITSDEEDLDDFVLLVFVPEADEEREDAAEEPDAAAEEEAAALVWLADALFTDDEGAAELVVSAAAEVCEVDGAAAEVAESLVGAASEVDVEGGASLEVVGASVDVGEVVVTGCSLVEVGGTEEVVSGATEEEVVGATDDVDTSAEDVGEAVVDVLAPVPTREF